MTSRHRSPVDPVKSLQLVVTVTTEKNILRELRKLESSFERTKDGYRVVMTSPEPSDLLDRARRIAEKLKKI
jgi:carbamate kinase